MYRRIFYVGVLALFGQGRVRTSIASFASIIFCVGIREASPFVRGPTNILAYVAQYSILGTSLASLILSSNSLSSFGLTESSMGLLLVGINVAVLVVSAMFMYFSWKESEAEQRWRRGLSPEEFALVNEIMTGLDLKTIDVDTGPGVEMMTGGKYASEVQKMSVAADLLQKYQVEASDIVMAKKLGSGSFGDVFFGRLQSSDQEVAIKVMKIFEAENIREFRHEILLTASLRHPNIVQFVGCCCSEEMVCLLLEYVARGTLGDFLDAPSGALLQWGDPLLRLAVDISKGMAFLHAKTFVDEADGVLKSKVVHRDLKPDNILVTDFLSAKVSDFGTSRAATELEVLKTSVGTPFYCAPELMRGETYDEMVDVYSFGLCLVAFAVAENVFDFINERFRVFKDKKVAAKEPMRVTYAMGVDGWRPVTSEHPIGAAPPIINSLITRCCSVSPRDRPTFAQILSELSVDASSQVEAGQYRRQVTEKPCSKPLAEKSPFADYPVDMLGGDNTRRESAHENPLAQRRSLQLSLNPARTEGNEV